MKHIFLITLGIFTLAACSENKEKSKLTADQSDTEKPETLVSDYNQSEIDKAIAKAKSTIDQFHKAFASKEADSYSIKAPITDPNGTEHFWLTDIKYSNGKFEGLIGNHPGLVKNVKFGQQWSVKENEISDWMYVKSEMIHGGFTIDPLLDSYPKEQADAFRKKLVR